MKRLFLAAYLVLLPSIAAAELPCEDVFARIADRLGLSPQQQQHIIAFVRARENDEVQQYTLASVYPPVFDITFTSGAAIHAEGSSLQLVFADYDFDDDFDDDDLPFEDYAGLCIAVFLSGIILFWIGFFLLSFQLALTGAELIFFVLALCL